MFKNFKLRTKIALGFAVIIVVSAVLGAVSLISMKTVEEQSVQLSNQYVPEVEMVSNLERWVMDTMYEIRGYSFRREQEFLQKARENMNKVKEYLDTCKTHADKYANLKILNKEIGNIQTKIDEYEKLINQTEVETNQLMENRVKFTEKTQQYMNNVKDMLKRQEGLMEKEIQEGRSKDILRERMKKINLVNEIINLGDSIRINRYKSQTLRDLSIMNDALGTFDDIQQRIEQLRAIARSDEDIARLKQVETAANGYKQVLTDLIQDRTRLRELDEERNAIRGEVVEATHNIALAALNETSRFANEASYSLSRSSTIIIVGLIAAIIIAFAAAWTIIVSITKPINRVVEGLSEGSQQVAAASEQLSSSSQQLAEGSAEQASSIEETSSTLEESASMVKQNTENTKQAAILARQAKDAADKGNIEMQEMMESMGELKKSSDEIAKIIKVIDEIAFQTNILALNAAVEAARAGDAGMGFAVVADEVRNLAQRSAQAAKDTASIIESNIGLSQKGVEVSKRVNEALNEINLQAQKVNELLDEVAAASQEQSQGIMQINKAITQMEQVVQENAANAEESASAAEELSAQSENLKGIVNQLIQLVNGSKNGIDNENSLGKNLKDTSKEKASNAKTLALKDSKTKSLKAKGSSNVSERAPRGTKVVKPEEVIPLEEDSDDF